MDTTATTRRDQSILIIGAGTWGLAAAYELVVKRGYTHLVVLDPYIFPSPIAAGNDVNKILEEGDDDSSEADSPEAYCWAKLHEIARHSWQKGDGDPTFSRHYHPTGIVYSAVGDDAFARVKAFTKDHEEKYTELASAEDFRRIFPPHVLTGDLTGWRGFYRSTGAGWVEARNVLRAVRDRCVEAGVAFITGEETGRVEQLVLNDEQTDLVAVKTGDGQLHHADHIILAAGAASDSLFNFQKQLRPTAWTLGHIRLNADQCLPMKNMPVLYNADRGFFIEPDEHGLLKVCDEHPGYINLEVDRTHNGEAYSKPFRKDAVPVAAAQRMRRLLNETMPSLADRPLEKPRICWDCDTIDRLFLIDRHPNVPRLIVAVGGSGNGVMLMPAVGKCVVDVLEGSLDDKLRQSLRWRPEKRVQRDWLDTQDRFGADGKVMDLQKVDKWTSTGAPFP